MIVRPLFNTDRETVFDGFGPTTALVPSKHFAQVESLEGAFAFFNADNRPNGRTERSVSVGDVIQVFTAGRVEFHAVASFGFERITRLAAIKALRNLGTPGYSAFADEVPVSNGLPLPVAIRVADNAITVEQAEAEAIKSREASADWGVLPKSLPGRAYTTRTESGEPEDVYTGERLEL